MNDAQYQDDDLVSITGGPLRPHEFVLVKPELDAADEQWIQNHAAKVSGDKNKPKDIEITLTIGDVQMATLQRIIKGWNLSKTRRYPDGSSEEVPFPYSPANIAHMPRRVYVYVQKKFAEMNPDEEEDGEGLEDFTNVVVDSSEANFNSERVVRLKH